MKSQKVINDPVYGFVTVKSKLIYQLMGHRFFQRLRRIKQLGLTEFVYPGARHTRFHHALGAMHLMGLALDSLKEKGHKISSDEYKAALAAILLHDIGHGPFSHALESSILKDVHHEHLSLLFMDRLNEELEGRLELAIAIFTNQYPRHFFHQLVSSQLDMDRLDYLSRDCFFTGVVEGKIGSDRIIRMLELEDDDRVVVQEKAIYSIENFLTARRLMYWQVYLHKTTVSTEQMLIQLVNRARHLVQQGQKVFATRNLMTFLERDITREEFTQNPSYLEAFAALDDYDIWACIKAWMDEQDAVLALLSQMFMERRLFRAELTNDPAEPERVAALREKTVRKYQLTEEEADFMITQGQISNAGYVANDQNILIKRKDGSLVDVAEASDLPNIEALGQIVTKHYLCYPKEILRGGKPL